MKDEWDSGAETSKALRLEGRVQGVGFRMWAARTAKALGVRGWVRNLPDGAVEIHVAARSDTLEEMKARLGEGPSAARVERVIELGEGMALPSSGFEIRR